MTPHDRAAEFVASYFKLTEEDLDISNFQRVLEMKVSYNDTNIFSQGNT